MFGLEIGAIILIGALIAAAAAAAGYSYHAKNATHSTNSQYDRPVRAPTESTWTFMRFFKSIFSSDKASAKPVLPSDPHSPGRAYKGDFDDDPIFPDRPLNQSFTSNADGRYEKKITTPVRFSNLPSYQPPRSAPINIPGQNIKRRQ